MYSAQFPELLSALLVYAVNPNFDQSAEGLLHLSCFLLLHFSSDREFAVKLNEPFPPSYFSAGLPPFFGTYADFLVIVCELYLCVTIYERVLDFLPHFKYKHRMQNQIYWRMLVYDGPQRVTFSKTFITSFMRGTLSVI